MSKVNDGGPAFPHDAGWDLREPGMSLRAWFAGQALSKLAYDDPTRIKWIVTMCWRYADEMLKASESV